jgi:GDPmannose 4,6-dehydratase
VTNGDDAVLGAAADAWVAVSGGGYHKWGGAPSAFTDCRVPAVNLTGNSHYGRLLRHEIYLSDGTKRVPKRILNAPRDLQVAFLVGYNLGDGLKAGNGTDLFKSFRTTSPVLAAGLVWLARTALERRVSIYQQGGALGGGSSYLINLSSGSVRGAKGAHLRRPQDEVRRVDRKAHRGWMFDIETTTGRFAAGVGLVVVHNSPRRGLEFVTRKISHGVASIVHGRTTELRLGNLDSQRDWGFAGDYVEAMWLMLQQEEPGTYVVSTDETHSVREFCDVAFQIVGKNYLDHVVVDPQFFRPAEVDLLVGDSTLARKTLGWEPKMGFADLVQRMVEADIEDLKR